MGEVDAKSGPAGAKEHALGPFDDDDGGVIEEIFDAESFEVLKVGDAIEVDVKNANVIFESVDESESWTGDFVFTSGAEAGDESFGEGRFAGAEFAGQKDECRRFKLGGEFPAQFNCFFGGVSGAVEIHEVMRNDDDRRENVKDFKFHCPTF